MTFFLLNEGQAELARKQLNQLDFRHGKGAWRYAYANSPESAIAYYEKHVLEMLRSCGLELSEPIWYETWTGRVDGLSYQDMLLVRKRYPTAS
jgi:hypothetical protein